MDIIKSNFTHNLNINNYFQAEEIVFLDIETTGLNRNKDMMYLIGFLYFDKSKEIWVLEQLFADSLNDEKNILKKTKELVNAFHRIITYNGDSFDIPFIEERMNFWNIDYKVDREKSFDLYKIVRKNKDFLNLPNLKLKTIEESLGFFREDEYSGYECIHFYKDFLRTGNKNLKNKVLKHNYDDLYHMLDIIQILDFIDDKKSLFIKHNKENIKFTIDSISINGDLIQISLDSTTDLKQNIKYYSHNYSLISENHKYIKLVMEYSIGYVSENEKGYYIDLLDFDLLKDLKDNSKYTLPANVFMLKVGDIYCIDNIKNLFKSIFQKVY